jgi:hypothetical protein
MLLLKQFFIFLGLLGLIALAAVLGFVCSGMSIF